MAEVADNASVLQWALCRLIFASAALLAAGVGLLILSTHWSDQRLTRHMLQHVVTMNVMAPALAWLWIARGPSGACSNVVMLGSATLGQIVLLWAWHLPGPLVLAHSQPVLMAAMHVSLMAAAFAFWGSIIATARPHPVRAVLALLITGKLYCLYGILLIFADRKLFGHTDDAHHLVTQPDQQLAGLIMVSACPLTYVAAAVAIVARWITALDRSQDAVAL